MGYDAFISYSHGADGRLAPAVQTGLQRFARPWRRIRALHVFRDATGLAVNPHLWASITEALDDSEHFVLLASPEAAASPWVNRELEHWLETKPADRVLPVLTDGELVWDPGTGDFDPVASTALPPALWGRFPDEPRHLDLRWARDEEQLSLRHASFRSAIAELAAPMYGVSKEALESEDVRQHRWRLALAWSGAAALLLLTVAALVGALFAVRYADESNRNEARAHAQTLRADREAGRAVTSAHRADRERRRAETSATAATRSAAEAQRQRRLAEVSAGVAATNASDARRSAGLARLAAARATRAQQDAEVNAAAARAAEADAVAATQAAQRSEAVAVAAEAAAKSSEADALASADRAAAAKRTAVSQALSSQALVELGNQVDLASLLAVEAWNTDQTPAARDALTQVMQGSSEVAATFRPDAPTGALRSAAAGRAADAGAASAVLAADPSGHRLAEVVGAQIQLWSGAGTSPVAKVSVSGATVQGLALSDAGHLTAWLRSTDGSGTDLVRAWDVSGARPHPTGEQGLSCTRCTVTPTPSGEDLVVQEGDTVTVLDAATLRGSSRPGVLGTGTGCRAPAWVGRGLSGAGTGDLCFSPGGRYVVGHGGDGGPRWWDLARDGAPEVVLDRAPVDRVEPAFSADDSRVAIAVGDADAVVLDPTTGHAAAGPFVAPAPIDRLALAPDGTRVAITDTAGGLSVFDVAGGPVCASVPLGGGADPASLLLAPDGGWAAARVGGTMVAVDLGTCRVTARAPADGGFVLDRRAHALVLRASSLITWDLAADGPVAVSDVRPESVTVSATRTWVAARRVTGGLTILPLDDATSGAHVLAGSAHVDDDFVFGGDGTTVLGADDGQVLRRWDPDRRVPGTDISSAFEVGCHAGVCQGTLVASADGAHAARVFHTSSDPNQDEPWIGIIDLTSGARHRTALPVTPPPRVLEFVGDGRFLLAHDTSGATAVLSIATGTVTRTDRDIVAVSDDGSTALLRATPGSETATLASFPGLVARRPLDLSSLSGAALRFRLDRTGSRVAVVDDQGTVQVRSAAGALLLQATVPAGPDTFPILSADGNRIAVWAGGAVSVWNVERRALVGSLPGITRSALAFSRDGSTLATAGPQLQLWDATSLEPLGEAYPLTIADQDPSQSTEGALPRSLGMLQFATNGRDVLIVRVAPNDYPFGFRKVAIRAVTAVAPSLAEQACGVAARELTPGEWARYHPGEQQQPTCPPLAVPRGTKASS